MADFGLGSDILDLLDSLDFNNLVDTKKSTIELSTEYPYIVFERADLVKVLNLCSKLIQAKSTSPIYNSIILVPVEECKSLYFYATNALSHFRYRVELLGNSSEILDENISISITILQKIVRLMSDKVLLYKKDGYYFVRLVDGDLQIDVRSVESNLVFFPGETKDKLCDLALSSFGTAVNSTIPLLDVKTGSNKINFLGEYMLFYSPYFIINSVINTPRMSLSSKDAEFISRLYKYYKDKSVSIFTVNTELPRLLLKLDNIEYEFINSNASISDYFSPTNISSSITVNYDKFYNLVNLATSLPNSQNIIRLYPKNNKLGFSMLVNNIYSDFVLDILEDVTPNVDIKVKADLLKKLLTSVTDIENLKIYLFELYIVIEYDNIKATLLTYN